MLESKFSEQVLINEKFSGVQLQSYLKFMIYYIRFIFWFELFLTVVEQVLFVLPM